MNKSTPDLNRTRPDRNRANTEEDTEDSEEDMAGVGGSLLVPSVAVLAQAASLGHELASPFCRTSGPGSLLGA